MHIGRLLWAVPLALSLLAGLAVVDFGYVLDDRLAILSNPLVTSDLPVQEAFVRDFAGTPLSRADRVLVWRPLLPIIWKFIWRLGDGSPVPFRILTVFLHFLATLLVMVVGKILLENRSLVLSAAALFAVHPVHSEALGSLVSQADLLSTVLGMFALWLSLRPCTLLRSLLLTLILALACLAKETAVVFGATIFLIAWIQGHRALSERLYASLPVFAITLGTILFQATLERGGGTPINSLVYCATGMERTLHGLYIMGRSITLSFVPFGLSPTHDYAAVDLSLATLLPYSFLAICFLVTMTAFFLRALETHNISWVIGISLLVGPGFIQSGLVVPVNTELAERLLYPSSMAGSAVTAVFLSAFLKTLFLRRIVFLFLTGAFLFQSWHVERKWRDNLTLAQYAIEAEPLSWRAHNNYAVSLLGKKQFKKATWHFMTAAYILSHRPKAVDPDPIRKLERLPLDQRLIEGPAFFAPEDPGRFVNYFYEHLIVLFRFPGAVKILAPYYSERYGLK